MLPQHNWEINLVYDSSRYLGDRVPQQNYGLCPKTIVFYTECYLRQLKHFVTVKITNDNCRPMTYFVQHRTSCIGTERLHCSFWGYWAEKAV